jgi:hypothetical protein
VIPISFQDKKNPAKNGHPSHRRFYGPRLITCCGFKETSRPEAVMMSCACNHQEEKPQWTVKNDPVGTMSVGTICQSGMKKE